MVNASRPRRSSRPSGRGSIFSFAFLIAIGHLVLVDNTDAADPLTHSVDLESIEISQSIQDVAHSVPLLEDRRTLVRVYLSATTATGFGVLEGDITVTPTAGGAPVKVSSEQPLYVWEAWNGNWKTFKRKHLHASLNFELPATVLQKGTYEVTVSEVRDRVTGSTVPWDDSPASRVYTIVETVPLRLQVLGLTYIQDGSLHMPRTVDYDLIDSWLRRSYPIATLNFSNRPILWPYPTPFSNSDANAFVTLVRLLDVSGGVDPRTHYYGLVSDTGFYFGGSGTRPASPDPSAPASGPAGQPLPMRHAWDDDDSYADAYAGHELGHTLGQRHVGGVCGESGVNASYPFFAGKLSSDDPDSAFVGLDFGDQALAIRRRALDGLQWHDTMSYCPFRWVGFYSYERIRTQLLAEDQLGTPTALRIVQSNGRRQVQPLESTQLVSQPKLTAVTATVDFGNNRGRIRNVVPVARATVGRAGQRTKIRVHFSDETLDVLAAEYPFEDGSAVIIAVFPAAGEVRRIELVVGDNVVDTRDASRRAPVFADGAIEGEYTEGRLGRVRWRATDPDRDEIRYSVLIQDDRSQWRTVLADSLEQSLDVSSLKLGTQRQRIRVRVIGSDGLRFAEQTTQLDVVAR